MEEILERIKKARFLTTDEIYSRRKEIRETVQEFDVDTLEIYQWYFFKQLCLLKNPLRDMLWDYLVLDNIGDKEEDDLMLEYMNYKDNCKRILMYQKKRDSKIKDKEEKTKKQTIRITCVDDLFKI